MDIELKKKALRQLTQSDSPIADNAIKKEVSKISDNLSMRTLYDDIKENLELLGVISYRESSTTIEILRLFLKRLQDIVITHKNVMGMPEESISKYQSKSSLVSQCLEILGQIRYHEPDSVFAILIEYSSSDVEEIAEAAIRELENLAEFNIDVFYKRDDWPGLGTYPQTKIIEGIGKLNPDEKSALSPVILRLCEKLLSPTMQATSSDYRTVTWTTSAVPGIESTTKVRRDALGILIEMFEIATTINEKLGVIGALQEATQKPSNVEYGEQTLNMITESTVSVLDYWRSIVGTQELPVQQKLEHNAYWIHWHNRDKKVREAALAIKEELDSNTEYQVFKVLVGFEGIFADWRSDDDEPSDDVVSREIRAEDDFRDNKAKEFATSITDDNFLEWKDRIVRYSNVQSDDMATFPVFGKFLEYLGAGSPTHAIRLVSENSAELERFLVPIFCGLWSTEVRDEAQALLEEWVDNAEYLAAIARIFEFNKDPANPIVSRLFEAAKAKQDDDAVIRVMAVVTANFDETTAHLVDELFLPALAWLTERKDSRWIFDSWYRRQIRQIVAGMSADGHRLVLDNLQNLARVDYHAEEILFPIAELIPESVVDFFVTRLKSKRNKDDLIRYEAVPFNFQKLAEPLSQIPERAVEIVYELYDDGYGMFMYGGGRLIKNIFPTIPKRFERKLVEFVKSSEERKILFSMAILRNYEGEPFLHDICKEIVMTLPADSRLLTEVEIILESTGVVSGEFGMANAYQRKRSEVEGWLDDSSDKVRQFARRYMSNLEKLEGSERTRAEEDLELRKLEYGSDED